MWNKQKAAKSLFNPQNVFTFANKSYHNSNNGKTYKPF
jgi:hypothetical protein